MLLAYDDYGPGPVVVLLHGFPLNRSMWSGQRTNLGTTYRVIAPDLRGHGESAAPEGGYTMEAMADDVVELLDALQIQEPIVLGGHSMGGYVALALLARHPERVRGLILMNTRADADSPEVARNREEMIQQVEAAKSVEPVVKSLLPRLVSGTTRWQRPELVDRVHRMIEKTSIRGVVGSLRGMSARPDRTSEFANIRVPTLLLFGAEDVISPPELVHAMTKALPSARHVLIPGAGHLAPLENPESANTAFLSFLREIA